MAQSIQGYYFPTMYTIPSTCGKYGHMGYELHIIDFVRFLCTLDVSDAVYSIYILLLSPHSRDSGRYHYRRVDR